MDVIEEQEALLKRMPLTAHELGELAHCRHNLYTFTGTGTLLGFFGGLTMGNASHFYPIGHGSEKLGRVGKTAIGVCTAIAGGCLGAAYGIQQAHRHLSELPNSELAKQVNRLLELQGKCRQAGRRLADAQSEADHDFERHLNQSKLLLIFLW